MIDGAKAGVAQEPEAKNRSCHIDTHCGVAAPGRSNSVSGGSGFRGRAVPPPFATAPHN